MNDYEVTIGFAGFYGIEQTYTVNADSEEEAEELAIEEAKGDLGIENVESLGDGEYRVTVNFATFYGADEDYDVDADSEEEAEELALDEASYDLSVESIELI